MEESYYEKKPAEQKFTGVIVEKVVGELTTGLFASSNPFSASGLGISQMPASEWFCHDLRLESRTGYTELSIPGNSSSCQGKRR